MFKHKSGLGSPILLLTNYFPEPSFIQISPLPLNSNFLDEKIPFMKKILIPVDFSGHTDLTCNYALEFSRVSGADILLFHTYFDQIIIADSSFPDTIDMSTMYNEELLKEVFHQAEKNISELKEKIERRIHKEQLNITIHTALSGGEIEQELRLICKDYQPDLVIMGNTGKGKTLNVWGKVSTFIIDHAKVPVLTIPEISKYKGFKNIMFATDLSGISESSIRKIIGYFSDFPIQIYCTHFIAKEKLSDEATKMEALKKIFKKEEKDGLVTFHLVETTEDNQTAINLFISENHIDLIAFQPHKHGFLYLLFTKKITKKNLFATNVPLFAIPVKEKQEKD